MGHEAFRRHALKTAAIAAFLSSPAAIGEPVTGELTVVNTAGVQRNGVVARAADGRSVVVWTAPDADGMGIFGRRYDARGRQVGDVFAVNEFVGGPQTGPDVAMAADGDFVVAWGSAPQGTSDGPAYEIVARRFSAVAAPLTGDLAVNTFTTGHQVLPAVATDAAGNFVVAWSSPNEPGDASPAIRVRLFDASGAARGDQMAANQTTTFGKDAPDVAMDASGGFVVVWHSRDSGAAPSYGVYQRRADAQGQWLGDEALVNNFISRNQFEASVAMDADGDYVVAWSDQRDDYYGYGGYGIFARRFDAQGVAQGKDFRVNEFVTKSQRTPQVTMDADGDFAVCWDDSGRESPPLYNTGIGVGVRRFSADGVGFAEDTANVTIPGAQFRCGIASDADGDLFVIWDYNAGGAKNYGIYGRRFRGAASTDVSLAVGAPATRAPGGAINYTAKVSNLSAPATTTGIDAIDDAIGLATNLGLHDTLPANVQFVSASGTDWTCAQDGVNVDCAYQGLLVAGSSAPVVTIQTFAPSAAENTTVANAASAAADEADPNTANNEDADQTDIVCAGTIAFGDATVSAGEAGPALVALTRTGGTCGAASVAFATAPGTAKAGDFTDADQVVTWADGESGAKLVAVTLTQDVVDEASETVALSLSGATGAKLGTPKTGKLTILDDDVPVISLAPANRTVLENVGNVTLTAKSTLVSTVDLVVSVKHAGTVSASDVTAFVPSITIPAGQKSASVSFGIVDDAVAEAGDETLRYTITNVPGRATIAAAPAHQAKFTVQDDD